MATETLAPPDPIPAIHADLQRRAALGIRGTTGGTIKHQAYEAALDLVVHLRRALEDELAANRNALPNAP